MYKPISSIKWYFIYHYIKYYASEQLYNATGLFLWEGIHKTAPILHEAEVLKQIYK